jgi:tetratricopeptide (TPR) repeat protein
MSPGRVRTALVAGALLAAVAAVYAQTTGFEFAHTDDLLYVTANDAVKSGLSLRGAEYAFTTRSAANWHPVTWLSLMLDAQLFGVRAGAFHATSALLHGVAACLLFGSLRASTGRLAPSAVVAALFALHPIHVESVAWVAERKDVLAAVFGFATLWAYAGYARRGGAGRYLGVALLYALGLMSKPTLVTWPFVLLLLDVWPLARRRSAAWLVVEKLPLLAASAAASAITWLAQSDPVLAGERIGAGARVANAVVAYARYLGKLVWPDDFMFFYPHPALPGGTPLSPWAVAGALALLAAVSALAWRTRARAPWLAVGWLWFLGVLVPMIGLVQVGRQALADRYAYLAFPGLYLALVWTADAALAAWRARSQLRRDVLAAATLALLVALGVRAALQVRHWRDAESLYRSVLAHEPRAPFALSGLAAVLVPQGRLDEAEDLLRRALEVDPDDVGALVNMGVVQVAKGDLDEAIRVTERSVALEPSSPRHLQLAKFLQGAGRHAEAEAAYRAAIAKYDGNSEARRLLAGLLEARGEREEADAQRVAAIESYERGLAASFAPARIELEIARTELERGRRDEARRRFEAALALDPTLRLDRD